jgi:hypothetical protein
MRESKLLLDSFGQVLHDVITLKTIAKSGFVMHIVI